MSNEWAWRGRRGRKEEMNELDDADVDADGSALPSEIDASCAEIDASTRASNFS